MQYLWHQPPPHNSDPEEAAEAEKEDADVCAICLEVPGTGTKNITVTACGHKFCTSCLLSSLRQKNTCPTCRAELEPPRTCVPPLSVETAAGLIREEERIADLRRRINVINVFTRTNGRASMMFSLCREFAFNVAHGIARWQKNYDDNPTDDTYHASWANFDSDDESNDDGSGSESDNE
jgi:hypothetical protein